MLRPAFQRAVDDDILVKNPFGFQLAGVVVNDSITREVITKDQMRKLLKFVHDDVMYCKYHEVFYFLLPTVEKAIDGYTGFLFYVENGMPLVTMKWQHRFNHMVGRYNDIYRMQMPNITLHVCRHTCCSNQAKAGMSPKTMEKKNEKPMSQKMFKVI